MSPYLRREPRTLRRALLELSEERWSHYDVMTRLFLCDLAEQKRRDTSPS